jgi:hypothetical protein
MNVSPIPSTKIGAIIGVVAGVILLIIGTGLVWYCLKRRGGRKTQRRDTLLLMDPDDNAPLPSQPLQPDLQMSMAATLQEPFLSPFDTPPHKTVPLIPLAVANLPSSPEADPAPGVIANSSFERPRAQGPSRVGAPSNSLYSHAVAGRIQAQIPVEENWLSRQTSMRSTLPPYSPGVFRYDEASPSLPHR